MELRVFAGWDALAFDARLHAPDVAPPILGERIAVDEFLRELDEPRADAGVTRDESRLGERLEFPCLRPSLEVRAVPAEGSCERALIAFGPEPGVDAKCAPFRSAVADRADEP